MSGRSKARRRSVLGPRIYLPAPTQLTAPGSYLTDDRTLFRIVSRYVVANETLVELEDCLTLDTWLVSAHEVVALRAIRPEGAALG